MISIHRKLNKIEKHLLTILLVSIIVILTSTPSLAHKAHNNPLSQSNQPKKTQVTEPSQVNNSDVKSHKQEENVTIQSLLNNEIKAIEPTPTLTYRSIKFSGKFHPIAVHFPIAFLLGAALMQWLFVFTKKSHIPPIVTTMLWLGSLGSILAATLGWAYAYDSMYFGEEDIQLLFLHRWLGTSTAILAVLALSLKHLIPKLFSKPLILALILTIVAALVGAAGHYGGSLTYGADNFSNF